MVAQATSLEPSVCADAVLYRCGTASVSQNSCGSLYRILASCLRVYRHPDANRDVWTLYPCCSAVRAHVWARITVSVSESLDSGLACQMITAPAIESVNSRWHVWLLAL